MTIFRYPRGAIIALGLLLVACSSSPPARFYTLTPQGSPADAAVASSQFGYSIAVGPVTLPEAVNRPQFVVRTGANRVVVLEEQRWAEPLNSGIAEAVAGNLSRELDGARVTTMAQSAAIDAQFYVALDVQRFDFLVGDAAVIEVVWSIKRRGTDSPPVLGHSRVRESAAGDDAYEALVAAQMRALATVSREIAARLTQSVAS